MYFYKNNNSTSEMISHHYELDLQESQYIRQIVTNMQRWPRGHTKLGHTTSMVIRVVKVLNGGYKIRKLFCLTINMPKGNY